MDSTLIERLVTGAVALFAAWLGYRANTRASAVQRDTGQLNWVREARQEAREAKVDSEKAEEKADSATRRLSTVERRLTAAEDQIGELSAWVARVVGWAQDPGIDHAELIRLINGGPPSWRVSRNARTGGGETT